MKNLIKNMLNTERVVPFVISLAFFMEAVDSTILNTAIPVIAKSFTVDPVDLKIALISYLLSLAIFIPISGWLADKFGAKRTFIGALIIFTLSSLWCGFSHTLIELMIARFIQGFGSAFGLPVGRLILMRVFGRENLILTMGRVIVVGSLGMLLGPVFGGVITHHFSWQWIFWVNIPVGLSGILLAIYKLPHIASKKVPKLDKIGFVLFGAGLAGFTFGLSALSETTIKSSVTISIILISIILMLFYILHTIFLKKSLHPIVKMDLFFVKTFKISIIGSLIVRIGFGSIPFLIPLLLQISMGFSSQLSGLLLAPIALGVLSIKRLTLLLLRALGYKNLLILNTLLAGLSIWSFTLINNQTPLFFIGILMFIHGALITIQYGSMNSLAYADVPLDHLSGATSIVGTLQQLSQSFGVAISALLIRFFSKNNMLTLTVFHDTFFAVGLITFLSTFVFLFLKPNDGQEMIK